MIQAIADATGLGVPTLKLLFTLLGGYPTAYIYRSLYLKPIEGGDNGQSQRNIFLAIAGLFWAYFYNGSDIIHSLICIAFTYAVCYIGIVTKQRLVANGLVFAFNLVYLLVGYVYNMQGDYDVSWTMPHCVLCLRLIGFGFDVLDGGEKLKALEKGVKKEKDVVPDAQKTAPPKAATAPRGVAKVPVSFSGDCSLIEIPSILEIIGYSYFFSAFLIGPQFSFRLYKEFIQLKNLPIEKDGKLPSGANRAALKAFLLGAFYLGFQQVLSGFFPASVLTSDGFAEKSYFSKLVFTWIYGRAAISKYLGAWILNEGAVILSGISYNGTDDNGNPDWGGLTNLSPYGFETATALSQIIATFNINTNFWIKQYIFKRLRFLNNKQLSSLGALIFLAIWHGIWPGYFICFFLEFLDMELETKLTKKFAALTAKWNKSPVTKVILHVYCYLYTTSALFYALTAFSLLKISPIIQTYNNLYWIGHFIVVGGLIFEGFIPRFKDPVSKESLKKTE